MACATAPKRGWEQAPVEDSSCGVAAEAPELIILVQDREGTGVPGVVITIAHAEPPVRETDVVAVHRTDAAGSVEASVPEDGIYVLTAALPGFQPEAGLFHLRSNCMQRFRVTLREPEDWEIVT